MELSNQQPLTGACIIGQSGGPSPVINASAYGVIKAAIESSYITRVLGASHGIKGIMNDELFDLTEEDDEELELLPTTPSSALGTCRYKLSEYEEDPSDYKTVLKVFKKYNVRYLFLIGGNDSMDTCDKLNRYMASVGYECRVIGVPKTIDNDLYGTDHTPGYGSAAKYVASTFMELYQDANVYDTPLIVIVEIMGRNAGWLTAASALANACGGFGPDLVYLPEVPFDMEEFMEDVERIHKKKNHVLVAVSEGIKDSKGVYISEYGNLGSDKYTDSFGHTQMGGLALKLTSIVKTYMNVKTRNIEFNLLQRCAAHLASETDIEEAKEAGKKAVDYALAGETGQMVAFKRISNDPYQIEMILLPLNKVANYEQTVPIDWINKDRSGVTQEFMDYALPLIQGETHMPREKGLPHFAKLKKVKAK